jgi:hypothetical protein
MTIAEQAVSKILGYPVVEWIAAHQQRGISLRECTKLLFNDTGVYVSHETLRTWAKR